MPKYLVQGNYAVDGIKGVMREGGSSRRAAVEKAAQSLGGKVESFYYAFGDIDIFIILELPDNVSAAAFSLVVNSSGAGSSKTTVLLSPEEMDAATKKSPTYRAPGQ